jgi:hypothetical protein
MCFIHAYLDSKTHVILFLPHRGNKIIRGYTIIICVLCMGAAQTKKSLVNRR